jgi:hypothetical protein
MAGKPGRGQPHQRAAQGRATQTSDVPSDLRPLAEWQEELGSDRLLADLTSGTLVAGGYDSQTGEWHEILRVHWQQRGPERLKLGIGWGWPVKRDAGHPFPVVYCKVYAARWAKHAGGPKPKYDWEAFAIEAARFVQTEGYAQTKPSKKRATLTDHLSNCFARQKNQYPSPTEIKEHVKKFLDVSAVSDQKSPRKPKST